MNSLINRGDATFNHALRAIAKLPASVRTQDLNDIYQLRDRLVTELTSRWVSHPWPTQFLIEVSPLVTWLWLGGIIAALGGLIAVWPVPRRPRRDRRAGGGRGRQAPSSDRSGTPTPAVPRERELVARMESTWPAT